MKIYVIAKNTPDYPQDVAHLYEHWFIMSFYKYAFDTAGMHGGTIGYVGGETYNNIIFIEAWFYDDQASGLFEQFLADEKLAPELLDTCMRQCQAEDRVIWNLHDRSLLVQQLTRLQAREWHNADDIAPYVYDDTSSNENLPFSIRKAAAQYKAVTITASLQNAVIEDQALFLRLHVIIADIINLYIQQQGWHSLDSLSPHQSKDTIYVIVGVSLPRGKLSNTDLRKSIINHLQTFDVNASMPLIRAHFDEFASQLLWKGRLREMLHDVNIVSSNRHIAALATEERVQRILRSLVIDISTEPYSFAKDIPY